MSDNCKGFDQEQFNKYFEFLATIPNLSPIFVRQRLEIEDFARDLVHSKVKTAFDPLRKYIDEDLENKSGKSADDQIATLKGWIDALINGMEGHYQDVATNMACILQAELAFLKGWIVSMINKDGELVVSDNANMEKLIEEMKKVRQAEKDDPESFWG